VERLGVVQRLIVLIGRVGKAHGDVHHHGGGRIPLGKGGGIDKRLEAGARLSLRDGHVDLAIDLLALIVQTTDHGQDLGGPGILNDHGSVAVLVLFAHGCDVFAGMPLRHGLDVQVDAGDDLQSAAVDGIRAVLLL